MNIDEARAICDGSNDVAFCEEGGFSFMAWIFNDSGGDWHDVKELLLMSDFAATPSRKLLLQAAAMVLSDKVRATAVIAARELSP